MVMIIGGNGYANSGGIRSFDPRKMVKPKQAEARLCIGLISELVEEYEREEKEGKDPNPLTYVNNISNILKNY